MKLSPERLKSISRNIRQARESMGYTQEKLAELAGISTAYYCQIELGNKSPSMAQMTRRLDWISRACLKAAHKMRWQNFEKCCILSLKSLCLHAHNGGEIEWQMSLITLTLKKMI